MTGHMTVLSEEDNMAAVSFKPQAMCMICDVKISSDQGGISFEEVECNISHENETATMFDTFRKKI